MKSRLIVGRKSAGIPASYNTCLKAMPVAKMLLRTKTTLTHPHTHVHTHTYSYTHTQHTYTYTQHTYTYTHSHTHAGLAGSNDIENVQIWGMVDD